MSFFEKLIQMLIHSTSVKSALAILEASALDPLGATNQRYAVPRVPGVFFNYITGAIAHACAQQDARENMWGEVCFAFTATPHMRRSRKCYQRCAGCVHVPDSAPLPNVAALRKHVLRVLQKLASSDAALFCLTHEVVVFDRVQLSSSNRVVVACFTRRAFARIKRVFPAARYVPVGTNMQELFFMLKN